VAIVEVVKYNGTPDVFAWKYPDEELGTWTQLIVNESQEAILFKGGKALDVFGSGRHTLSTANIPILSNLMKLPFGGKSPFTAEVWYVNKVNSLDIKWGTASPIQLQDPKYGVFVPVRSFGQFGIQIVDSKSFLVKLVGTLPMFDKENVLKYFRSLFITKVKDGISSYLVHKQIGILEINAYLDELSSFMLERIGIVMSEYGIKLVNFYINDVNMPEDDPAVQHLKATLSKKAEMNIIGYTYQQSRSYDTLEGAVNNESGDLSGLMGAGIGMGMGVGLAAPMGNAIRSVTQELALDASKQEVPVSILEKVNTISCAECQTLLNKEMKFCFDCGKKLVLCPNCQNDIHEGQEKCLICNHDLPRPCPNCATLLKDQALKFCPECGFSLLRVCIECGVQLDKSTKFCPECGVKQ